MYRFILYCGWVVENYPLQVYAFALVFSPARSITRGLFKQEVQSWITTEPVAEEDWNACLHTMEHSDAVMSVAFSPDSKLVASGSCDNTVKIWDAATGSCTQTLEGHSRFVNSVAFSPDSKSRDKTIKIWDAATGTSTQTLEGHGSDTTSLFTSWSGDAKLPYQLDYGISSDGRWITSGSEKWLWLPPGCQVTSSAVVGSTIAIGCTSGRVLIITFPSDH